MVRISILEQIPWNMHPFFGGGWGLGGGGVGVGMGVGGGGWVGGGGCYLVLKDVLYTTGH